MQFILPIVSSLAWGALRVLGTVLIFVGNAILIAALACVIAGCKLSPSWF
jgi:hypothetical protein